MGNYLNLQKGVENYLDNCPPSLAMSNKIVNLPHFGAITLLRPGQAWVKARYLLRKN